MSIEHIVKNDLAVNVNTQRISKTKTDKSNKCNSPRKPFKATFENSQWRKVQQMQPMRLCLFSGKPFGDSFENAQWREAK